MKFEDVKKRVVFLKKKIKQLDYEYYIKNNPSVSDQEYDNLMQELICLEKKYDVLISPDSPTKIVSGGIEKKFNKFYHNVPMLSLGNAFDLDDLYDFDKQVKNLTGLGKISYVCELKIDGLSISLVYEDYILKSAATRGNGYIGEDVTANIKMIRSVPLKISQKNLIVRGEVYIPIDDFSRINYKRRKNNEIEFANPRNAASGTLRQLDPLIVLERNLNIFLYQCINAINYGINSQYELLEYLNTLNFKINHEYRLCDSIEQVWEYIKEYQEKRYTLEYEIDGVVIKVNNLFLHDKIGCNSKNPKWAIAYKFPPKLVITKLLDIFPTVGRTGKITYNAKLEPVKIVGTIVKAATLHNANFIIKKDIRIGDFVYVKKAGDIIPEVVKSLTERRSKEITKWSENTICPNCCSLLKWTKKRIDQYCVNLTCNKKIIKLVKHFCSRDAMNIEGISEKIIEKLFNFGYLSNFSDLYRLEKYHFEIIRLKRFGEKLFSNIITSINNSKNNSLERLLFGLGIRHVGQKTAKMIASKFLSLDNLKRASVDEILLIDNVGLVIAKSVVNFFRIRENINEINKLLELGVNQKYMFSNKMFLDKLKGCNFVITGSLSKPRRYFKNLIELFGGIVKENINLRTTFILCGIRPGNKLSKARKLSIKIINEDEFNKLISN